MPSKTLSLLILIILFTLPFGLPEKQVAVKRDINIVYRAWHNDQEVADIKKTLNETKPLLILIGNSMLGEAVDPEIMTNLIGIKTAKYSVAGSTSAYWYLAVKNVITQLDYKGEYVGIFFRDNFLTLPRYKVYGKNKIWIDYLAGSEETVLDKLAYLDQMSFIEKYLHQHLPLYNKRDIYKDKTERELRRLTANLLGLKDYGSLENKLESVFDNHRMNPELLNLREIADDAAQDLTRADMSFKPENTFLPHIISLCKTNEIKLFFVRVKRLRDANENAEPPDLKSYISKLEHYLKNKNVPLFDFSNETRITSEHFGRGDHLNRGVGRQLFSEILSEKIQDNYQLRPVAINTDLLR